MTISKTFANVLGANGVLLVLLTVNVVRARLNAQKTFGEDTGVTPMNLAIRTHANFIEFAPLFLLILLGLDQQGDRDVAKIGWAFTVARVAHAIGLGTDPNSIFRKIGFLGTVGTYGWASTKLLLNAN